MSNDKIPTELSIPLTAACTLSLECWRLRRLYELMQDSSRRGMLGHAVRQIDAVLKGIGMETLDFVKRTYDAGMAPEVLDVQEDDSMSKPSAIIDETVAPTVTWRGQVVVPGQIIVKRSSRKPESNEELQ